MAESPDPMLQFFQYAHLPPHLRVVSVPFCNLAHALCGEGVPLADNAKLVVADLAHALPRNPERTAMLRKLLEAKDCAVRAVLYQS